MQLFQLEERICFVHENGETGTSRVWCPGTDEPPERRTCSKLLPVVHLQKRRAVSGSLTGSGNIYPKSFLSAACIQMFEFLFRNQRRKVGIPSDSKTGVFLFFCWRTGCSSGEEMTRWLGAIVTQADCDDHADSFTSNWTIVKTTQQMFFTGVKKTLLSCSFATVFITAWISRAS